MDMKNGYMFMIYYQLHEIKQLPNTGSFSYATWHKDSSSI